MFIVVKSPCNKAKIVTYHVNNIQIVIMLARKSCLFYFPTARGKRKFNLTIINLILQHLRRQKHSLLFVP